MSALADAVASPTRRTVVRWAWASVVANSVIILTGGAVRLTASGLGCPTWPRCTDESFTPHSALGAHGVIEFGNRMLTYVLVAIAIGTWVAVLRSTSKGDRSRLVATLLLLGIPAQGLLGGVTVLTDLNPWIVALHLMLSMALVAGSTLLLSRVAGWRADAVPVGARRLVAATWTVLWVVLYLGTVVTGSGPHAGDVDAPRNGLDPATWSHVHAFSVYVLVGLTVLSAWSLRRAGAAVASRAALVLLGVELAQGLVGFVQYFTDLPIVLVWLHLLGASLLAAFATRLLLLTGTPHPAAPAAPRPDAATTASR
ncbi:MAG: COX15/CtaA family protein [Nocardioidaceae bacterium]|nr:COX15/CtaA family protein [Nocardioidaceae bacterium]